MLLGIWEIACASARKEVLEIVSGAAPKRGKDAVRDRVLEAVSALYGLPNASEVAGYFDGQDTTVLVRDKLPAAVAWLNAFAPLIKLAGDDQ